MLSRSADAQAGTCTFIEDTFEETFNSGTLNVTRWDPEELDGLEHCIGLPPSGNTTCTMMVRHARRYWRIVRLPTEAASGSCPVHRCPT